MPAFLQLILNFKKQVEKGVRNMNNTESKKITIDGITYIIYDNSVSVCEVQKKGIRYAIIPSEVEGKPVNEIMRCAFEGCNHLKAIILPNSILWIREYAFKNCKDLMNITFPDSLLHLGDYAFLDCKRLKKVTFSNNIKTIGMGAFEFCESLVSIDIPDSVTSIYDKAFWGCTSLKIVKLPYYLTEITEGTFTYCESLETIEIPDCVTTIGKECFCDCKSLVSIKIPDNLYDISNGLYDNILFANCNNLKHVQFSQALVDRPDADVIFNQLFEAGLHTREILLRIPSM